MYGCSSSPGNPADRRYFFIQLGLRAIAVSYFLDAHIYTNYQATGKHHPDLSPDGTRPFASHATLAFTGIFSNLFEMRSWKDEKASQ